MQDTSNGLVSLVGYGVSNARVMVDGSFRA